MKEEDTILIGFAIGALGQAEEIVNVLVNRGTLQASWGEIASVLALIRADLAEAESQLMSEVSTFGASFG
jgi:hypothetical protein